MRALILLVGFTVILLEIEQTVCVEHVTAIEQRGLLVGNEQVETDRAVFIVAGKRLLLDLLPHRRQFLLFVGGLLLRLLSLLAFLHDAVDVRVE